MVPAGAEVRAKAARAAGGIERDVAFEQPGSDVAADDHCGLQLEIVRYGPSIVGTVISPEAVRVDVPAGTAIGGRSRSLSSGPSRPPLPIGHLAHKRQWHIQVAAIGESSSRPTIQVGGGLPAANSTLGLPLRAVSRDPAAAVPAPDLCPGRPRAIRSCWS